MLRSRASKRLSTSQEAFVDPVETLGDPVETLGDPVEARVDAPIKGVETLVHLVQPRLDALEPLFGPALGGLRDQNVHASQRQDDGPKQGETGLGRVSHSAIPSWLPCPAGVQGSAGTVGQRV